MINISDDAVFSWPGRATLVRFGSGASSGGQFFAISEYNSTTAASRPRLWPDVASATAAQRSGVWGPGSDATCRPPWRYQSPWRARGGVPNQEYIV